MAVPNLVTGQHARAHSAVAVASLSVSLPGAATPGNSIHVISLGFNYAFSTTEISDNQGNGTYTRDELAVSAGAGAVAAYSKQNVAASGTFTVTDTYSPNSHGDLYVAEFSGVLGVAAVDKHANSTPTPTGNPAVWTGPASGAQSQAGDLAICAANAVGNVVTTIAITTAGWTAIDSELDGTQYDVSIWGWRVVPDTATQQPAYQEGENSTSLGTCPSLIVTYKAAPDVSSPSTPHHPSTLFRPWARHPAFGQDTQVNLAAPVSQSVAPQHPASLFRPWKNKPLPYQPIPPAQPAETVASNVTARSPSTLFRPWARRPLTPDVVPAGGAVRVIAADAIVATSAVTASLAALRPLTPAAINATSPVTASVAALKQFQAAVAATSAVTAAATRIAALQAAAVNATSSVGAAISGIAQNLVDNYRMKKRRRF